MSAQTQGWSYKSWIGNWYPAGTPAADCLKQELNRWAGVIDRLVTQGVAIWGFTNNHYQGHALPRGRRRFAH